ncbi:MAG: diguanylate cyclase (GGDEF)-like protein [Acidimicrobiales bacterium]|jgi:diguanylate cyclase (GGDEF)-like protein
MTTSPRLALMDSVGEPSLKTVVSSSEELGAPTDGPDLDKPTLASLFVDPESLTSPPAAVLQVLRKADEPNVTFSELSKLVEMDVAICVQILRMANSALYSPASEITTIERALTLLGLRSLRLLVLSTSLRMLMPDQENAFDTSEIRRRMVVSGSLARRVCSVLAKPHQDEAFLAGLLTGLGPIVLAEQAPALCRVATQDGSWPTPDVEQRVFGFTSDQVTVGLIQSWGLPVSICQAIEHRSLARSAADSPVTTSLQVALLVEGVLCSGQPEEFLEPLHEATEELFGMGPDETNRWVEDAEPLVAEAASMLELQFPQVQAFSELLAEGIRRMQASALEAHATIVGGSRQLELLSQKNVKLQHEATTDSLTGLPNRGSFDEMLARNVGEHQSSAVCEPSFALLLMDLDHFKAVNDTYGHRAGDEVLRAVGSVLSSQLRDDDVVARYGGEEFVVVIQDATMAKVAGIAERLRSSVADAIVHLESGETLEMTVSIGGTIFGEVADDSGSLLINRADTRLYQAKRNGRNQSVLV